MYAIQQNARINRFGSGGAILRGKEALTDDQLRNAAPSIFAEGAHESRSDKFTYIPTSEVLRELRKEGFQPYEVRQGGSRDIEKRNFTKHMIRLRRDGDRQVGDSMREIVLLNAHDGTSSYQLMSGLFRLVCSNGLVIADGDMQTLRIPHKGDIAHQVIEGAYQIIEDGDAIDEKIQEFKQIQLSPPEQEIFAKAAAALRFEEGKNPVTPDQLNRARRSDDTGASIWNTFNRVQENLVKGGLYYTQRDANGRRVASRRTRPVNSIDGDTKLNQALWTLASEMQALKNAA